MISQELCNELHGRLLAEQQRLDHEIDALAQSGIRSDTFLVDESDAIDQHPADEGSELFEREKNLALQRNLEVSRQEVRDALQRFDEGTYGICAECGKPIPENRLRALPSATHCIECQAKLEREAQPAV